MILLTGVVLIGLGILGLIDTKKLSETKPPVAVKTPVKTASAPTAPSAPSSPFSLTPSWVQNFQQDGNGSLDPNIWTYDLGNGGPDNPGWGNDEAEYYTNLSSNVSIIDGQLVIEARQQDYGGQLYTSARIKTEGNFSFEYGRLDIVAQLPSGTGTWPAIWLLPENGIYALNTAAGQADPNNWLRDGEIDIMEAAGDTPNTVTSSAQSYTYNPGNGNERIESDTVSDSSTTFHDYSLEWTPTSLTFLVDGMAYHQVNKNPGDTYLAWPYDQAYYLIINLAMGGDNTPQDKVPFPPYGIDNSTGPWFFKIKSISYYPMLNGY